MKKIICLLLILVILAAMPVSISADAAVNSEFVLENLQAPIVEHLKDQTNQLMGRSIWDMTIYDGKLFIGIGDYGSNLGQKLGGGIPLLCYTNETNVWELASTLDDEQVSRFFVYNNKLYIPGTDPIKRVGSVYFGDEDGMWTIRKTFDGGIHTFDMLISDNIMYACYGQDTNAKAVIRYSTDFGTFNDIEFRYDGNPIIPAGNEFARSYNLFEFGGEVYATLKISNANNSKYNGIYKLDKTNMVLNYVGKAPNHVIANSIDPSFDAEFKGNFVYAYGTLSYTNNLADNNSWKDMPGIEGSVTCAKVINGSLYFTAYTKNDDGKYTSRLYKTNDLETAQVVYALEYDSYIQSFCNENDAFYLGTGGRNETTGTVFLLSPVKYGTTDIKIKAKPESFGEDKPKWVKYQLKAGDKIIKEGILNDFRNWEFNIEGVDDRDDWSVVITEASADYKWKVESKNGVFVLSNAKQTSALLYIAIVAAALLIGGAVTVILLKRKKKTEIAEN